MTKIYLIQERLKQALLGEKAQYIMAPENRKDLVKSINSQKIQDAAIMLVLFYKEEQLHCILLQRAQYKGYHSGQICFPGGKFEIAKDKNLKETAIRESYEEIHLSRSQYKIIGQLSPLIIPISKIRIQSFVCFAHDISNIKPDGYETTHIFKIPLNFFTEKKNINSFIKNKLEYPYYDYKTIKIWGATAMIMSELIETTRDIL